MGQPVTIVTNEHIMSGCASLLHSKVERFYIPTSSSYLSWQVWKERQPRVANVYYYITTGNFWKLSL